MATSSSSKPRTSCQTTMETTVASSSVSSLDRHSQLSARQQALCRALRMKRPKFPPPTPPAFRTPSPSHLLPDPFLHRFSTNHASPAPELPIVCGPAAFTAPPATQLPSLSLIPPPSLPALPDSKRKLTPLQYLEDLLFHDDSDSPPTSPSDLQTSSHRDWSHALQNLLVETSSSTMPVSTLTCSSSSNSDELSTDRSYTETGTASQLNYSSLPLSASDAGALSHKLTRSLEASGDSPSQPKQLLIACATAIADGKTDLARSMETKLRQFVHIDGDPQQRLGAYLLEGLMARIEGSGNSRQGRYKMPKENESPSKDHFSAMKTLYHLCPYIKFGYMAANGAIAEACKDAEKVHIIDFAIGQGSQSLIALIGALAARPSGPPQVRITGVADPESICNPAGGLQYVGKRLEEEARLVRMPFRFDGLAKKLLDVQPCMLDRRPGEALVVNLAFQLHRLPDESVCTTNPRDRFLRMVKSMAPKVVTLVEKEANTNTTPFLRRFLETLSYYGALFEFLEQSLSRDSANRMNIEQHCLAPDIRNIIACEGSERLERCELAGKWRARMSMAGFRPFPMNKYVNGTISPLLQSYSSNYTLKEEADALYLGWKDRDLVVASAWQ